MFLQQFYPKFIVKLQQIPISIGLLSEIYCKITTNSDFNMVSIRNLLQNCNKFRLRQSYYLKFTANCGDSPKP